MNMFVLWCLASHKRGYKCGYCGTLKSTWCCQCLLHLEYVLAIYVCCGGWSTPGAVSACCIWHMCWLYLCIVVLGTRGAVYVLPIYIVRYLAHTWCKSTVTLVKFKTLPIFYGTMEHYIFYSMYTY